MFKKDCLTVQREIHEIQNGEAVNHHYETIYENLKCHLSVAPANTVKIHEIPYLISEYKIFLDYSPDIKIKENDKLNITTSNGETYELFSGEVKIYNLSIQIKCRQKKVLEK